MGHPADREGGSPNSRKPLVTGRDRAEMDMGTSVPEVWQ